MAATPIRAQAESVVVACSEARSAAETTLGDGEAAETEADLAARWEANSMLATWVAVTDWVEVALLDPQAERELERPYLAADSGSEVAQMEVVEAAVADMKRRSTSQLTASCVSSTPARLQGEGRATCRWGAAAAVGQMEVVGLATGRVEAVPKVRIVAREVAASEMVEWAETRQQLLAAKPARTEMTSAAVSRLQAGPLALGSPFPYTELLCGCS